MHQLSVLVVFCVFMTGCSNHIRAIQHYQQIAQHYNIPSLDIIQPIKISNNQYIKTPLQLATSWNGYRLYADLNQWTATAVNYTKAELAKRSAHVDQNATNHGEAKKIEKQIKIAITHAYYEYGQWLGIRCYLSLRAETSDGYIAVYQVNNHSSSGEQKASDGAIIEAVVMMLNDEKIIGYLLV